MLNDRAIHNLLPRYRERFIENVTEAIRDSIKESFNDRTLQVIIDLEIAKIASSLANLIIIDVNQYGKAEFIVRLKENE